MNESNELQGAEMPRYRSHKEVHAVKIEKLEPRPDGGALIFVEDPVGGSFPVDQEYLDKHDPKAGGYFVVYKDGYRSWSPADAFESGYTRIEKDESPPPILEFFKCNHLPDHLRKISGPCASLAGFMAGELPNSAELSAGLRKLLEAKDCFVRARIAPGKEPD